MEPGLGLEGVDGNGCTGCGQAAGQLLTWDLGFSSPDGQGLNTVPWALTTPPTPAGRLPGTMVCVSGRAGSVPPFQCGGSSWSPEPGSRFVPRAGTGWAPHCPHWPAAHRHRRFLDRLLCFGLARALPGPCSAGSS